MSNSDRTKWDYFLDMNIVAFFNTLSFYKDRQNKLRREQSGINQIIGNGA